MRIIILPSAMDDLAEGRRFYELQQSGLGVYFLEALFSDIESLKLYGGLHRKVFGYHRILSKRFPYLIYYDKEAEVVIVKAVLDCRRDPQWIRKKLSQS